MKSTSRLLPLSFPRYSTLVIGITCRLLIPTTRGRSMNLSMSILVIHSFESLAWKEIRLLKQSIMMKTHQLWIE